MRKSRLWRPGRRSARPRCRRRSRRSPAEQNLTEQGRPTQPVAAAREPDAADRDRRHRHAGRHLGDRQQGAEATQRAHRNRHPDHRERAQSGNHPGQVCGAAVLRDGAAVLRDGDADPPFAGGSGPVDHAQRRSAIRNDRPYVRDAEFFEDLRGAGHRCPVTRRSHDDINLRDRAASLFARTVCANDQSAPGFEDALPRHLGVAVARRQMAEFAPRPSLCLAVVVKMNARDARRRTKARG